MIGMGLTLRVIVGLVAFGVAIHLVRWRRRSRADWDAYDQLHHPDDSLKGRVHRPSPAAP
jgi:hypothetical protein